MRTSEKIESLFEDFLEEAVIRKRVVRDGGLTRVRRSSNAKMGFKIANTKERKMSTLEKVNRKKAQKKASIIRKGKMSSIISRRKRSMAKRRSLGL